jgi:hypothetical protein
VTVQVERGLDSICFLLRRPVLNNNPYVVVVVQSNHRQKRRRKMCPCVCYDGSIRVEGKTFFRGYSRYFCVCCVIFLACRRDHFHSTMTTHRTLVKYYYAHATDVFPSSCLLRATSSNDTERESLSRIHAGRRRPSAIFLSVVVLSFELITGL